VSPRQRTVRLDLWDRENWCFRRNFAAPARFPSTGSQATEAMMGGLIYLIGLIVVILAILSFFGLR
jgi:hypothetical protein